jgi:hypothetical protein
MTVPMGSPISDDSKTLFRLILDGKWHRYDEIKEAIAKTVPPGRALRRYERQLQTSRAYHRRSEDQAPVSEDDKLLYGARTCAQNAISSWKERKAIIHRVEAGTKWIKMKPGFEPWLLDSSIPRPQTTESGEEPGGLPEAPPGDSEPSEADPEGAQEAAALQPEPQPPPERSAVEEEFDRLIDESSRGAEPEPESYPRLIDDPAPPSLSVIMKELPSCVACGLLITDETRHANWHEDQKQASAAQDVAIFDEVTLRTLLGDVMRLALDSFQAGMQGYLDHRFAEVEARLIAIQQRGQTPRSWTQGQPNKHPKR